MEFSMRLLNLASFYLQKTISINTIKDIIKVDVKNLCEFYKQ